MNQILSTKLNSKEKNKKKIFKIQFHFSILSICIIIFSIFFYLKKLSEKENISNSIIKNYNISKLYSSKKIDNSKNVDLNNNTIFGIIEIPSINVYYPIFSNFTDELLKISPCKLFGRNLNAPDNICIAGHNYDNSMFFSKITNLKNEDKIFIYDTNGEKYIYKVIDLYEVNESELSPIFDYNQNEKILTLITCNNINLNRIIVRAKQEE